MMQTDGRKAEEMIENLLTGTRTHMNGDEVGYISLLEYFFSCLFIKFMEDARLLQADLSMNPLLRYNAGARLVREVFADNLNTRLLGMIEPDDSDRTGTIAAFLNGCDELVDKVNIQVADIGPIFESFYNREYHSETGTLRQTSGRKESGMFFTSPEAVRFIIRAITDRRRWTQLASSNFLDSSMGGGIFLFELLDFVEKKRLCIREFLENRIYGVDKNPLLVDIVRVSLWIKYSGEQPDMTQVCRHVCAEDSLTLFGGSTGSRHTWRSLFPDVLAQGGFDYILGNPPWGKIKASVRDFSLFSNDLTRYHQGASLKSRMAQDASFEDWEAYRTRVSRYAEELKQNPAFQYQKYMIGERSTGGDFDLYKYFLELSYSILKDGGKLGYIIPASFYVSESATGLRHLLLENGTIEYLINYINKKHIFPIHTSYKFVLLVYGKHTGRKGSVKRAAFNLFDLSELSDFGAFKKRKFVSCSVRYLNRCSKGYWSVPEFRNDYEKDLLLKLYTMAGRINRENARLCRVSYVRELDMTLDSTIFHQSSTLTDGEIKDLLPVYEGRMVNQFDSAHKLYISGSGRTAVWKINPQEGRKPLRAQYYVRKEDADHLQIDAYRACYCEITGQGNVRTILASLIPPYVICGNKVPTCKFKPDNGLNTHLYWIGVANSFLMDWVMRKKMTITINFFHWAQIPFPYADAGSVYYKEIIAASAILLERINEYNLAPFFDEYKDQEALELYAAYQEMATGELRLKIDCAVAGMIGLTVDEMINVLYDFPSLDHGKKGIGGDRRYGANSAASYVTRDTLLYQYIGIREGCAEQDVVALFAHAGLDISMSTGEIRILSDRIRFYRENYIQPY